MPPEILSHITYMLLSIAIISFLTFYSWRGRKTAGAIEFFWLMLCISVWLVILFLEQALPNQQHREVLHSLRFVGVSFTPVAFFIFIVTYTGQDSWLTRQRSLILFIFPCITQIIVWTNPHHGWFAQVLPATVLKTDITMGKWSPGPWFWIHAIYSYGLLLLSLVLILRSLSRSFHAYRMQAIALVIGSLPPLVVSILATLQWIQPVVSYMFYAFAFMGVIFAWGIFRHRLLNLVPVAHSALFDVTSDGMLAIDAVGQIVEVNPAMEHLLDLSAGQLIGRPFNEALSEWGPLAENLQDPACLQIEFSHQRKNTEQHYDLRTFPLKNRHGHETGKLAILREITALKRAQNALQEMAITDPLTGIHNRRYFFQAAQRELKRTIRYKHPLTAIMVDIDHFKHVNDTCGHADGDEVLRSVAQCLQRNVRQIDILCRYGGEEFAILLSETNIEQAMQTAERIRLEIENLSLIFGNTAIAITISLGLAEFQHTENLDQLLRHADKALYEAKHAGRNKTRIYSPDKN